jgi:hypothetical protein
MILYNDLSKESSHTTNNVKWIKNRTKWGRPNQKWWSLNFTSGIPWITACLSCISRAINAIIACNFVPMAKINWKWEAWGSQINYLGQHPVHTLSQGQKKRELRWKTNRIHDITKDWNENYWYRILLQDDSSTLV